MCASDDGVGVSGGRVSGATRVAGVIGWPVAHSLSPAIHNAAFAALGLDWIYVALPVPPGAGREAVAGLRRLGIAGANVTMPHKTDVARAVDELSETARALQAVNTVVVEGERLVGHNTDAPGLDRFLRRDAAFDPAGRTALLYGAGGAARACALALARAGLARLVVAARDPARVSTMGDALGDLPTELVAIAFDAATAHPADLVVNATPLGADGRELPLPEIGPGTCVVDLLYHPSPTPLTRAAKEAGAAAFGGLGLLLHQAALSFELWTGQVAPLEVMSAAAVAALAERD
jgi:shikimate dehydrogenase